MSDITSDLEEMCNLHTTRYRMKLEEKCYNDEPRCQVTDNDSDSYSFGDQCNIDEGHDGKHRFGLDSMLYGMFPPSTCTDDKHDGSCSVCIVRSVRER